MVYKSALESKGMKVNQIKMKVMVSKIDQIKKNHPARKNHVEFLAEKEWQLEYYVNLVEIGYMGDIAKIETVINSLAIDLNVGNARGVMKM